MSNTSGDAGRLHQIGETLNFEHKCETHKTRQNFFFVIFSLFWLIVSVWAVPTVIDLNVAFPARRSVEAQNN